MLPIGAAAMTPSSPYRPPAAPIDWETVLAYRDHLLSAESRVAFERELFTCPWLADAVNRAALSPRQFSPELH